MTVNHPTRDQIKLENVFTALGNPMRLTVVRALAAGGEYPCGSLLEGVSKSTLTHHWRVLREGGLIWQRPSGRELLLSLRREDLDVRFPDCWTRSSARSRSTHSPRGQRPHHWLILTVCPVRASGPRRRGPDARRHRGPGARPAETTRGRRAQTVRGRTRRTGPGPDARNRPGAEHGPEPDAADAAVRPPGEPGRCPAGRCGRRPRPPSRVRRSSAAPPRGRAALRSDAPPGTAQGGEVPLVEVSVATVPYEQGRELGVQLAVAAQRQSGFHPLAENGVPGLLQGRDALAQPGARVDPGEGRSGPQVQGAAQPAGRLLEVSAGNGPVAGARLALELAEVAPTATGVEKIPAGHRRQHRVGSPYRARTGLQGARELLAQHAHGGVGDGPGVLGRGAAGQLVGQYRQGYDLVGMGREDRQYVAGLRGGSRDGNPVLGDAQPSEYVNVHGSLPGGKTQRRWASEK